MVALLWIAAALAAPAEPGAELVGAVAGGLAETPVSTAVRLLLILTAMSFLPGMLIVMTPFVRFIIVFSMMRQALGLSQSPPNQVLVGLSLFLSLLVMQPTLEQSYDQGLEPFLSGTVEPVDGINRALEPMRSFMMANTRKTDMLTMLQVAKLPRPDTLDELPTAIVTSAFVLSELKTALTITVYIFIPFLVIDLVVSSILLGMGMMMLPPTTVSLPLKIMIFVLSDGWAMLIRDMVAGINR
jgi:flagellar biosynthetic protein FliP